MAKEEAGFALPIVVLFDFTETQPKQECDDFGKCKKRDLTQEESCKAKSYHPKR
jgi:hypothetical protein